MIMQTDDLKKEDLIKKLTFVKAIIGKIIEQVEAGHDWVLVRTQLIVAISQLKSATRQLALHHLRVCLVEKLKGQKNQTDSMETINEFVHTYNYLQ